MTGRVRAASSTSAGVRAPTSTYRLQLTADFDLHRAARYAPGLAGMGVGALYLSPVLAARPGSPHGYDVVDPSRIDPERGGEAGMDALLDVARDSGLGVVLDLVPNHMAAAWENPWWRDVLRYGRASPHAAAFDIDWEAAEAWSAGRLLLPFLGDDPEAVLAGAELVPALTPYGLAIRYFDRLFPLDPGTWPAALRAALEVAGVGAPPAAMEEALAELEALGPRAEGAGRVARARTAAEAALAALGAVRGGAEAVARGLSALAGADRPGARPLLERLLAGQAWELAEWRAGADRIAYRRFFDISDLVAVRVDREEVFERVHARALELVRRGARGGPPVGLRIDHVDGLREPGAYLRRLREAAGPGTWIVVEKILVGSERLHPGWPVQGTTGYDFLNAANGLFLDEEGLARVEAIYERARGAPADFGRTARMAKRAALRRLFAADLRRLARRIAAAAVGGSTGAVSDDGLDPEALREALVETSAALDVYRTYWPEPAPGDLARAEAALAAAGGGPGVDALARALLAPFEQADPGEPLLAWQQLTGPAMAKGHEDTALYRHAALVSVNAVGGDPDDPPTGPGRLHALLAERAAHRPAAMNATSTHDAKRGEDVRARIDVLAEIPDAWEEALPRWRDALAAGAGPEDAARLSPDLEVLLLQTAVGALPLTGAARAGFPERLRAYAVKAAREARSRTNWRDPDPAYEAAVEAFVDRLAEPGSTVAKGVEALARRVAAPAALTSLAQVVVKVAAPGVPDLYRGAEGWDLSLVDPDNRRPLDWDATEAAREAVDALAEEHGPLEAARALLARWEDGDVKRFVTARALRARAAEPTLFLEGDYRPVAAAGPRADRVFAFARRAGDAWALCVAGARFADVCGTSPTEAGGAIWRGTGVSVPEGAPARWRDALTGREVEAGGRAVDLDALLGALPAALLLARV